MIKELLSESSTVSMVRLMSLICILCATGIACYGIACNRDLFGLAALVSAFVVPAFGGKVAQKFMER